MLNQETIQALQTMAFLAPVVVPVAILWTTGKLAAWFSFDVAAHSATVKRDAERVARFDRAVVEAKIFFTMAQLAASRGDHRRATEMRGQGTSALLVARSVRA